MLQKYKYIRPDLNIETVAVPCVGNENYLKEQIETLYNDFDFDESNPDKDIYPKILKSTSKTIFSEPTKLHYEIWKKLEKTNIKFDLVYAPKSWEQILNSWENEPNYWENCNIMYIHSGGANGNESQLDRYRHAKLI